jgi:hypothetical protein
MAIYPREQEVRLLFEHGVRLKDDEGLLEGAGSQTRFIRVRKRDGPPGTPASGRPRRTAEMPLLPLR